MIDYTNLYIKNLDSEVTSYDLFKRFRIFGKIISARVMKDTITGKSKGYGFVSFSHMDEANEAKKEMNGQLINSKNIVVTFHEHKKTVKKEQDLINLNSPPTTIACYPSPQSSTTLNGFIPEQQQQAKQTTYNTNPWNESGIWMQQQQQQQRVIMPQPQPQPIITTTPTYSPPHSYGNNNTMMMSQLQPQPPQQQHYVAPSAAPSASFVSQQSQQQQQQQTNLQNQIQYQKLREAVSLQLNDQTQLDDIVDLIQSLKKRELSLCLFNPTFLKQKIDQALEALTLFHSSGSGVTTPSLVQQGQQQQSSIASSSENNDTTSQVVATILSSLEGMTLNKKKRVFGDIFFPYVRVRSLCYLYVRRQKN